MMLNGQGYELREPEFAGKKPLYNLDRIAADAAAPVWIVEGEKAADALVKLGAVATTSGGASSAADADWSQLTGGNASFGRTTTTLACSTRPKSLQSCISLVVASLASKSPI